LVWKKKEKERKREQDLKRREQDLKRIWVEEDDQFGSGGTFGMNDSAPFCGGKGIPIVVIVFVDFVSHDELVNENESEVDLEKPQKEVRFVSGIVLLLVLEMLLQSVELRKSEILIPMLSQ